MPRVDRLQAEAEEAQVRSEMARSRSQAARNSMHELRVRWSIAQNRKSIDERKVVPLDRFGHGRID
jgi:hypothetical protein